MGPSAAPWQSCHVLHKLGVIGILLSTLLFLVGFSVPAWVTHFGLWMRCSSSLCISNLHSHSDAWINTVRVMECVALLAYVLCAVMEVLQNCFQRGIHPPCNRIVEILAVIAGIVGITGAVAFGVHWSTDKTMYSTWLHDPSLADELSSDLQWGFGLVVVASVIILLSAFTIGYSRHRQAQFNATKRSVVKTAGKELFEEEDSFRNYENADSSAMMLVPVSHFDTNRTLNNEGSDPPPYALPPPYPYPSACNFFLPIADSSMVSQIVNNCSPGVHSQVVSSTDQSLSLYGADRLITNPPHSFISPGSSIYVQNKHPVMRPLFIKTEGGSEIEITPSAQNSSGLPSPFNHF